MYKRQTQHFTAAASARLAGHGSPPFLECVCSTKLRALAAKFEGRRWSVSTSRSERGGLTQFGITKYILSIYIVPGPTSQAKPRDTVHLRPSNLAARTVSLVEHTLSNLCRDPCPVGSRTRGSGEVLCAKARFFLCRQRSEMTHITNHYRRHCSRVSVR